MQGKVHEAELIARQTVARGTRSLGTDHPDRLDYVQVLRGTLREEHQYAESEALSRELLDITQRLRGANDFRTADARYELAMVLALEGKQDEAVNVLSDAVAHGLKAERIAAMQTEPTFRSLRGSAGFKALVADTKQRTAAAAKPD